MHRITNIFSNKTTPITSRQLKDALYQCTSTFKELDERTKQQQFAVIRKYIAENKATILAYMGMWQNTNTVKSHAESALIYELFTSLCHFKDASLLLWLLNEIKPASVEPSIDFSKCVSQLICYIVRNSKLPDDIAFYNAQLILENIPFNPNVKFERLSPNPRAMFALINSYRAQCHYKTASVNFMEMTLVNFLVFSCINDVENPNIMSEDVSDEKTEWELNVLRNTRVLKLVLALPNLALKYSDIQNLQTSSNLHTDVVIALQDHANLTDERIAKTQSMLSTCNTLFADPKSYLSLLPENRRQDLVEFTRFAMNNR